MFEHEVRVRLDLLAANQERLSGSLTRMEVELVQLCASLPEDVVQAIGTLFYQERERVEERFAELGEQLAKADEQSEDWGDRLAAMDARFDRLEQRLSCIEADVGAVRRHLLSEERE